MSSHSTSVPRPKRPGKAAASQSTAYAKDFFEIFDGRHGSYYGSGKFGQKIIEAVIDSELSPELLRKTYFGDLDLSPESIRYFDLPEGDIDSILLDGHQQLPEIWGDGASHGVAIHIDLKNRKIEYQDSHGVGMTDDCEKAFRVHFPGFEIENYGVAQQGRDPACAFYTALNLIQLAQGLKPRRYTAEERIELRKKHAPTALRVIEDYLDTEISFYQLMAPGTRLDAPDSVEKKVLKAIRGHDAAVEVPHGHYLAFVPHLIRLNNVRLIPPKTFNLFAKARPRKVAYG